MKNNKKGFTIVELVIVIAIIAILAAVLIPTFSNVIGKAKESSCLQEAKTKFEELYALDYSDGTLDSKEGENKELTAATIKTAKAAPATGNDMTKPYGGLINTTNVPNFISGSQNAKYVTENGAVKQFCYTDGTYTAKFDGTDWTVVKYNATAQFKTDALDA